MSDSVGVLITRPEPDAGETAQHVRALGYEPIVQPVMEVAIKPPPVEQISRDHLLIVTSKNAVRALAALGPNETGDQPVTGTTLLAVGKATGEAARALGIGNVHVGPGGGSRDLLDQAITICKTKSLAGAIYLRGRDISFDLAAVLNANGLSCREIEVYSANPVTQWDLPPKDRKHLSHVLHFSPRQAELYADLAHPKLAGDTTLVHLCLSTRVSTALATAAKATPHPIEETDIQIANYPTQPDLLTLLTGGAARPDVK